MRFSEAFVLMMNGHKVKNKDGFIHWYNKERNKFICSRSNNICFTTSEFKADDILSGKWELWCEDRELHTAPEAIEAYRKGKFIKRRGASGFYNRSPLAEDYHFYAYLDEPGLLANDWEIYDNYEEIALTL